MSQVQARVLYQDESLVGACNLDRIFNCNKIVGPKDVWIVPGRGYMAPLIAFRAPTNGDPFIKGVWVSEAGKGYVIDGTLDDFTSKCNACCGEDAEVTPVYNGNVPDILFDAPLKTYTVQVKDAGDNYANEAALNKYTDVIGGNPWTRTSYNTTSGVSTYTFKSTKTVHPKLGADGVTMDIVTVAPLVYTSNAPGALASGNHYTVVLRVNGQIVGVPTPFVGANDATLATVATALNADTDYNVFGTFGTSGSGAATKLTLTSTTVNNASIVAAVVV